MSYRDLKGAQQHYRAKLRALMLILIATETEAQSCTKAVSKTQKPNNSNTNTVLKKDCKLFRTREINVQQ